MRKPALILDGAPCIHDDLAALEAIIGRPWPWLVIAVNSAGFAFERVDHWVTLHPEEMHGWKKQRRSNGFRSMPVTWSHREHIDIDRQAEHEWGGSGGGFAAKIAVIDLACFPGVLCGIPLDRSGHFLRGMAGPWNGTAEDFRKHWTAVVHLLRCRVKSMSGWTRDLLGAPDAEWLGVRAA